jgi:multiple sugar transport system permease protein
MASPSYDKKSLGNVPGFDQQLKRFALGGLVTLFTTVILLAYLSPFGYMVATSLKNREQMVSEEILPRSAITFRYEGEPIPDYSVNQGQDYPIYLVPQDNGETRELAFIQQNDDGTLLWLDPKKAREGVFSLPGDLTSLTPATEPLVCACTGPYFEEYGLAYGARIPQYILEGQTVAWLASEGDTHYFTEAATPTNPVITWEGDFSTLTAVTEPLIYTHRSRAIPDVRLQPGTDLPIYNSPLGDGAEWGLVQAGVIGQTETYWVDIRNPQAGIFAWSEIWYPQMDAQTKFDPQWGNYEVAWTQIEFPRLLANTLTVAILGMFGTIVSSILVAYAFARFPLPGKNLMFFILIGTIILPRQVTLVPTFAFFSEIGWSGSWLPLIVPHFFANAYNVFLLRQFFRQLPRELDEAAMIDGASPAQILWWVIIPQSYPAIVAIALFHFVFAWNDYFEPLIYLLGNSDLHPITVGIQEFNYVYDQQPYYIQATALMGLVIPVLLFFAAQRVFMRGIVVTGVDK